jgi:hypothetical protein
MDNNFNRSDLNVFLSEKEKREIEYLNNKSNKLQKISEKQNDPMHMTLTQLINLWATTNIHILIDLTNFFSGLSKYKVYFDDIDETGQWFTGLNMIGRNLIDIFTKEQRGIYVGITLIIISFALYLIQITS